MLQHSVLFSGWESCWKNCTREIWYDLNYIIVRFEPDQAFKILTSSKFPGGLNRCAQRRMGQCYFQRPKQLQNLIWLWAYAKGYIDSS